MQDETSQPQAEPTLMRRRGTIKSRSSGSYRIRYSLGRDPVSGKRRFGTATVRGTRQDDERELTRLLRTADTGEHVDPSRMTVGGWLDRWIETVGTEVSPKTHESYAEIVRCYLKPALGGHRLDRLMPSHIQDAYSTWAVTGRRDRKPGGLSPSTRRYIHIILKAALTRAVEQQALPRNPCDAFKKRLPKIERKEMVTLTVEEAGRLLKAIAHSRVYWPMMISLATVMRRGEILAVRWKNVDLDRGILRVMESLEQTRTNIRFKPPKTDRTRVISLPPFAIEELRRLKRVQAEELLRLGIRQSGETLVCCREDGQPKHPAALTSEFSILM